MTERLNIIEAMTTPELLGAGFEGSSWDAWKCVLRGAFALPMTPDEVEVFRELAQRDPPNRQVSELIVISGRRAGKDSIAALIAAHAAAFRDYHALRPGERAVVQCLAVSREQAQIVLGYTRAYFSRPPLSSLVERETANGLELTTGATIDIVTNSFRGSRGRSTALAIFDECAFWRDESSAQPDKETYRAIKPGLATVKNSMLIMISSPYRKSGLLHDKFRKHFGKSGDVLVIVAPSIRLNPTLDQATIDKALADDPEGAPAEWLGTFRNDIAGWAPRELIEGAIDPHVAARPPVKDVRYFGGCDPSGGVGDAFACGIAHAEGNTILLDALVEIAAPFTPTAAVQQIASVLKTYGIREVTGDKYSANWVVEAFARHGITYKHSERDRSAIYLDALPLFTAGRARLVDSTRIVNQFTALERRSTAIGKDRVDHPPAGHDDCCNAAALALVLAAGTGKPPLYEIYVNRFSALQAPPSLPDTERKVRLRRPTGVTVNVVQPLSGIAPIAVDADGYIVLREIDAKGLIRQGWQRAETVA
jgi:hypothetical protein